jgi:acetyltransferase-like isoleucine patch superfamily enzyme
LINPDFGSEPFLVSIGDHVSLTGTQFVTHDGGVWVLRDQHPDLDVIAPIEVGNNVFIGIGCTILPGVTIGNDVVIGAGSVVTRDIPSNVVAAGVPARVIKSLAEYREQTLLRSLATKLMDSEEKRRFLEHYFAGKPQ